MNGHIEFNSIQGPLTGKELLFGIYLPRDYPGAPDKKFSVIYLLHGLNEDCTFNIEAMAYAMEKAVEKNLLPPMIIVSPDGYTNSMWMDSIDGKKPAETNVIKELIPYIENRYQAIPHRKNRIIAGFSMGGYGALRFALKLPEMFSLCVSIDGAIHTIKTFKAMRKDIFQENFHQDVDYFKTGCVYELAEKNAEKVRARVDFFLLAGVLETFNDRFYKNMAALNLPIKEKQYIKTGCDHDIKQILDKEGLRIFSWIGERF